MILDRTETENSGSVHQHTNYFVANIYPKNKPLYFLIKRMFDILFSALLLVMTFIPMLVIVMLIQLDGSRPPIYRQERLGKDGKPFMMYKFRTMRMDAEKDGPQWAEENDPRCTKLGRFLRHWRLDELPQLWNILIGDMSFVGPRPERAFFYDKFEHTIHGFRFRLRVKPGLTGLAQVNGGYELGPKEKIAWDMEYIRTQSVWTDLLCILKTAKLVFTHEGAR